MSHFEAQWFERLLPVLVLRYVKLCGYAPRHQQESYMTWIPDLRLSAIYEPPNRPSTNSTGAQVELLNHIDATAEDLATLVRLGNTLEIRTKAVEVLVHKHPNFFRK